MRPAELRREKLQGRKLQPYQREMLYQTELQQVAWINVRPSAARIAAGMKLAAAAGVHSCTYWQHPSLQGY
jgi:hypothetical protein